MRIFNNESMWDAENQKWYDTFYIDGNLVDEETYHEQLEVEMLVADDEMELKEEFCKCCNCEAEDCPNFNCTCDMEVENGNVDEYMDCEDEELEEVCECPICTGKEEAMELCCYCEECMENYMKESIGECLEVIFEDSCPECKIDSVLKLAYKCLELGKQSTRQDVMEYLEK